MKKVLLVTILMIVAGNAQTTAEEVFLKEAPLLEQVSEHCYLMHIEENGENIALVVTEQGTLLFDPPPEPDLSALNQSLESLNGGPVRWMVNTGNYFLQTAGVEYFSRRGAVLLAGFRQYAQKANGETVAPVPVDEIGSDIYEDSAAVEIPPSSWTEGGQTPGIIQGEFSDFPRFIFKNRMYLYPENLEIQISALQHEARTEADVFAYVPAEKVLFTGRLFEPSYYPDIDVLAGGSALKWIDALGQVIDSVPLLISAIPEEPEEEEAVEENEEEIKEGEEQALLSEGDIEGEGIPEEEEEEIPLEEMIMVISARGEVSSLLMMKDLLDTAMNLRKGITRAVKAGKSCEKYLDSPDSYPYQTYGNYYPYATQLCREISLETGAESQ